MNRRVLAILLASAVVGSFLLIRQMQGPLLKAPSKQRVQAPAITPPAPVSLATPAPQMQVLVDPSFSLLDNDIMQKIHGRFATGDFVAALKFADDALANNAHSALFHRWILAQLPVLLTSAGWARLKLGDCDTAIGFLRRSETIKRSSETAKGLAVCYYKNKNLSAARDQFSYYLEHGPQDPEMGMLFADVLESEERYDDAVKVLEQLSATPTPDMSDVFKKALNERLASMRARSKESPNQRTETSRNFHLLYRTEDHEDLVAFVLSTLEDALDEYADAFQFQPPPAPIEVTLYPASDFKDLVTGGPAWAEGLFDGRLRIPIRAEMIERHDYKFLRLVLRHELVHALFANMNDNRNLPSWFDEGMAQRLSCGSDGCGKFPFPATPPLFMPTTALAAPYTSLNPDKALTAYLQSLYLVNVLEYCHGDGTLRQLVQHVGKASDISSDGLLKPLGITFDGLRTEANGFWTSRSSLNANSQCSK